MIHDAAKTSPSLAALSDLAERTFWRIVLVLDDFGRYHGTDLALLAAAFPVPPSDLTRERFAEALHELESGDLLRRYGSSGRTYIYSPTWSKYQRTRSKESKYPQPPQIQGRGQPAVNSPPSAAVVVVGDVVGDGDAVGLSPGTPEVQRPAAGPPLYVRTCPDCAATLRLLNDLCATMFNAPSEAGAWMHLAHEQHGLDRVLAAVRRKHAELEGDQRLRRFMAPSVFFKPKNFDVTVNDIEPAASNDELPRLRV
jgi:hypothetical protein